MSGIDQVSAPTRIEMPKRSSNPRRAAIWIIALLAVVLLALGIFPRIQRHARANELADAASTSLANVLVVPAKLTSTSATLELPGNIQAINLASIYARTNGYVQERYVDIGSPVKSASCWR